MTLKTYWLEVVLIVIHVSMCSEVLGGSWQDPRALMVPDSTTHMPLWNFLPVVGTRKIVMLFPS